MAAVFDVVAYAMVLLLANFFSNKNNERINHKGFIVIFLQIIYNHFTDALAYKSGMSVILMLCISYRSLFCILL